MKTFLDYLEESHFQVVNRRRSTNEYALGYDTDEDEDKQQLHEVVFNYGTEFKIHVPQAEIDNATFNTFHNAWEMKDELGQQVLVQLYTTTFLKPEGF